MSTRHPRSVYDEGSDPDVRFSLANERTLLAWTRTALALTGGAIAVHAPALGFSTGARTAISVGLLALAGIALSQGWYRWRATELAVRTGAPLPGFLGGIVFIAGTALALVATLVVTLANGH